MIADFVNFQEMKCEAMPRFLLFFILTFSLSFSLRSESLESADGRVIQVELTRKNATHVWFKMPGKSKESSYEIAKLSEASKKLVEAWTAPKSSKFEVDFSSGKRNQKNTYGDIDDRCYSLLPKIKVRNLDSKSASFSGKAHLFIFGSPLKHRGDICLLAKRVFDLPTIEANKTHLIECKKEIHFSYDDSKDSSGYGVRYKGYLLIFVDEKGVERYQVSVPTKAYYGPLSKFAALPLPKNNYAQIFNENFIAREGLTTRIK